MKTALVTGWKGFVGRHMRKRLEVEGYDVYGMDTQDGHEYDCREFFRKDTARFDLVVHCAAVVGGRAMIDGDPLQLITEDLTIDAEMFRWAMRTRPGRIVYFSSSAAYPVVYQTESCAHVRLPEFAIPTSRFFGEPDQTYGWVKLTGERMAAEANAEGIKTHVFRPFSGYGADQDDTYPFPAIIKRARELTLGFEPFEVWGDPESTRDWVHIKDVVNCVMAHIEEDVLGPVNICTGRPTSFRELATLALEANGITGRRVTGLQAAPMGVFHRVGDPTLMQHVYTPQITIEEGVALAVAHS